MSIWTRNHTELAKLAKNLQDRNAQTRDKLAKRLALLSPPNPLDPRKSRSESCLLSVPEEEAKENIFSRKGNDDPDEGSANRLRVDSFSSVDSAISPDFSRGPLSPILKQTYLNSSDAGSRHYNQCNGIANSKTSDKRVTFILVNGNKDESDTTEEGNDMLSKDEVLPSSTDTHRCHDGDNITGVSTSRINGLCHSVSSKPKSKAKSDHANDCGKRRHDSLLHPESCLDHVVVSLHSSGEELHLSAASGLSARNNSTLNLYSPAGAEEHHSTADSDPTDPCIDNDNCRSIQSIEIPEAHQKEKDETSTQGDEEMASVSLSTAGLNLSSELNLLLISLLANHRREQLLISQEDLGASSDGDCPEETRCNGHQIPDHSNESTTLKDEDVDHELHSACAISNVQNNSILQIGEDGQAGDSKITTDFEIDLRNGVKENIKLQVTHENQAALNTGSIESSRKSPDDEYPFEWDGSISTGETLFKSKEPTDSQLLSPQELSFETTKNIDFTPVFLKVANSLTYPSVNLFLHNDNLTSGHYIPASDTKYTVAGNSPSTFVYSHLYQQRANSNNSNSTCSNNSNSTCFHEAAAVSGTHNSFVLGEIPVNNACHKPNNLVLDHSAVTFSDGNSKVISISCESTNNAMLSHLLNHQTAYHQNITIRESDDGIAKDQHGPSISAKGNNLFYHLDAVSEAPNIANKVDENVSKNDSMEALITRTKHDSPLNLEDSIRCRMMHRVSEASETSTDSLQTSVASLYHDNDIQAKDGPDTLNVKYSDDEAKHCISVNNLDSNSDGVQRRIRTNIDELDLNRTSRSTQCHVTNTLNLSSQCSVVSSTPLPLLMSPPLDSDNASLPRENYDHENSANGREEIVNAPLLSSRPPRVSVVPQTESKTTADALSQTNDIDISSPQPKTTAHSVDAFYNSSSNSTTRDSLSVKHQHRYKPRLAKSLRHHGSMEQNLRLESSSYDTEESSVYWNHGCRKDRFFNPALAAADSRDGGNRISLRHQLERINDNISWIIKSQNTPPSRYFWGDSSSSGTPRRKKRSRNTDSSSSHRHTSQDTHHSGSSRNSKSKSAFEKVPPKQRTPETVGVVDAETVRPNVFNFVFGSSQSGSSDELGRFICDSKRKEFQKLLENCDLFDVIHKFYPSRNLKTVKDTLRQLSVVLRQQRHCNKENVMKEIADRSNLFRKFDFNTKNEKNRVQCIPLIDTDNDSKERAVSASPNGFPKMDAVKRREKQAVTTDSPPPPSSISSREGTARERRSAKKKMNTMVQQTDLLNMESLLDKMINSDVHALCDSDALRRITEEWRLMKLDLKENDYRVDSIRKDVPSGRTNGLTNVNPFRRMTQFLLDEKRSQPPVLRHSKNGRLPEDNSSSITQQEDKPNFIETSHQKFVSNSTKASNQLEEKSSDPAPSPHVFRPLNLETDDLHDQKAEEEVISDSEEEDLPDGKETPQPASAMESDSQLSFRLDREFDKNLADMKPYVLKLPLKTDRQKCAVWIKKFCEPPGPGLSLRKTRNMYAQLMVQMLRKGTLSSPFDQKPQDGPLQPLPSYMSIYFDDLYPSIGGQAERLPDWVEGELGDTGVSSAFPHTLGNPAATSTWVSSIGDFRERPHSSMGHTLDKDPSLSPIRNSEYGQSKPYSMDDRSIEVKGSSSPPPRQRRKSHNSPEREKRQLPDIKLREEKEDRRHQDHSHNDTDWSKPYTSSITSLPKGTTFHEDISYQKPADREVAVRTKMIEAKFHEEKLKLQQKHDAAVQKILDRKNTEIEDVKNHYRVKSKEMEETIGKLEKKVQTLMKETDYVRENKDKQISEMKKLAEDSNENRRKEFEKRLHDIMSEFEQEKFDMQKQHTQNIQEILDDTNSRLQRMEAEYSQQTTTTTNVIKELESRVQQLMNEVDTSLSQRSLVEKDRNETQAKLEKVTDEYERLRDRHQQVERDHQVKTETHEHELRSLKNKTEASLEFLKQEHTMAASKAADTISELEQKVDQLKKSLKDSEENRHRQNREMEQVHQQDKLHMENLHDKQVRNMKKEIEQLESDWSKKLSKLKQQIKDKEGEMLKLREQKQQQALQAEQALEEFKSQVEKNQTRMYDEMKQQMEQVENDLSKSKQLREKQAKEFTRQQEEDKYKQQHEIAELKMSFEGDKSQLMRDFHVQKEYIIGEHDKEVDNVKEIHRAEIQAMEARMRERQDKSDKAATDGERLIRELREELVQANQLRKQQLVELGLLREEEKQKVQRDHEAELSRLRTDLEQQRLEQQKTHSAEMEAVLEKTNGRLKGIEQEYAERGNKSAESIAELQSVVLQLRGDIKRSRESSDEKLAELKHQYEEERQNLRKQYAQNMTSMQKELESQHSKTRELERRLQKEESDQEEMVTQLKLQFEEKIRGLMPADVKQELEDTIASLKSQVASLQQRALMLQEELDSRNRSQLGPFGSRTSSPIKSTV